MDAQGIESNFKLIAKLYTDKLLEQISENSHWWNDVTKRQDTDGSPHNYTKTIFLRWTKELTTHAAFNDIKAINYPAFTELNEALKIVHEVLHLVGSTQLGRVLLVALEPGGIITPHADEGLYADSYERFHVCLSSKDGNLFFCGNESVHMKEDELWYFNHKTIHSLINKSDHPRIHLIVDCIAPKYRRERV